MKMKHNLSIYPIVIFVSLDQTLRKLEINSDLADN